MCSAAVIQYVATEVRRSFHPANLSTIRKYRTLLFELSVLPLLSSVLDRLSLPPLHSSAYRLVAASVLMERSGLCFWL